MGEFVDKVKGATNEAVGKAKAAVGKTTDDPKLSPRALRKKPKGRPKTQWAQSKASLATSSE